MANNGVFLGLHAAVAKSAAKGVEGVEAKCRAAFSAVREEDWNCSSDNDMFNGALCGVVENLGLESEEGQKVAASARRVNKVNAVLQALASGVPVNMEAAVQEQEAESGSAPYPLMVWWRESKPREGGGAR